VLRVLNQLGVEDVTIYRRAAEDVPPLTYRALDYRPVRNLLPGQGHWQALRQADAVLCLHLTQAQVGSRTGCAGRFQPDQTDEIIEIFLDAPKRWDVRCCWQLPALGSLGNCRPIGLAR